MRKKKKAITWILSNRFLKKQSASDAIKKEIKKYLETDDNENTKTIQNLWDATKAVLSGIHSDTCLPQKKKKKKEKQNSNKQPNLPPKRIRKKKNKQNLKSVEGRK